MRASPREVAPPSAPKAPPAAARSGKSKTGESRLLPSPGEAKATQVAEAARTAAGNLHRLAESQLIIGQADAALRTTTAALQIDPADTTARLLRGRAWEALGKPQRAAESYREALERNRGLGEAHFLLGRLLHRQGDDALATAHLREAVRWEPDLAKAHYALGVLLGQTGRPEEALAELLRARELDPTLPDIDRSLAVLYAAMAYGAREKATAYLDRLPPDVQQRVRKALQSLASERSQPPGGKAGNGPIAPKAAP